MLQSYKITIKKVKFQFIDIWKAINFYYESQARRIMHIGWKKEGTLKKKIIFFPFVFTRTLDISPLIRVPLIISFWFSYM